MRLALRGTLVLTLVVFAPGLFEGWEAPKAAVVRVAGFGVLAAVLARPGWMRQIRWQPLDAAVAAWLAVEVLATVLSAAPRISLFGDPGQHEGLLTSVALAGLYLGARLDLPGEEEVRGTLEAWIAGACVASAYAFVQLFRLDPLAWIHGATLGTFVRPIGTLGHPNTLGVVTGAAGAAAVALALVPGRARGAHAAALALLVAATLVTFSRSAWLALAVGSAAALALGPRGAARLSPRAALVAAGLLVLVAAALALSPLGGLLAARVRGLLSPTAGSGGSRLDIWRAAWEAWRARPWLGHGPDTFGVVFPRFQPAGYWRLEWNHIPLHAHSVYLHVLATRGALGALAGACGGVALAAAAAAAWRGAARARACVGALVGGLVAMAVTGTSGALGVSGALVLVLLAGMTANLAAPQGTAAAASGAGSGGTAKRRAGRLRAGVATGSPRAALAGLAAAAVGVALAVSDLGALRAAGGARRWIDRYGSPTDRVVALGYAVVADQCRVAAGRAPWGDVAPRTQSELLMTWAAGVGEPAGLLRAAEDAAREAVRRVPLRAANHRRLADALAGRVALGETGRVPECEAEFARAAALAPHDAFVLVEWSRARLEYGDASRALETARRVAALYPDRGLAQEVLGEALLEVGDTTRGRVALERAVAGQWDEEEGVRERARALIRSLDEPR